MHYFGTIRVKHVGPEPIYVRLGDRYVVTKVSKRASLGFAIGEVLNEHDIEVARSSGTKVRKELIPEIKRIIGK
jgi:hypothetical protein